MASVPKDPMDNTSTMVQWGSDNVGSGDNKTMSEPVMTQFTDAFI